MSSDYSYIKIVGAVLLPNIGGLINGRKVTRDNLKEWYETLNKPSFRPPNWVFAPVWTSLYSGMGYASYLVWRDGGGFSSEARLPLAVYGAQLGLNWIWSYLFFGRHDMQAALTDIVALTATSAVCGALFYRVNNVAGYIFIPYLAWLGFATFLNYTYIKLNPEQKAVKGN